MTVKTLERHKVDSHDATERYWRVYVGGGLLCVSELLPPSRMREIAVSINRRCSLEVEPATGYGICFIY